MKLCINCKYYRGGYENCQNCLHSVSLYHTNLVNGYLSYNSCIRMRDESRCGKDAKLYEEKEPSLLKRMMFWK